MKLRWLFVISMLWLGWHYGGGWGVYSMLMVSALCLAPFAFRHEPGTKPVSRERFQTADEMDDDEEVVVGGIKGHRDPTRPTEDDYAAMITNNYGRRAR